MSAPRCAVAIATAEGVVASLVVRIDLKYMNGDDRDVTAVVASTVECYGI